MFLSYKWDGLGWDGKSLCGATLRALFHDANKLSENIWFVWSRMSYSGDMDGCHARGQRTTDGQRNMKIGLEFWKQNSQYDKIC